MAKSQHRDERGRVKFRVVEFELEGSDASLQDALRNLATALSGGGGKGAVRVIENGARKPAAALTEGEPLDADLEQREEEATAPETPRKTRAGKPRVSATPEVLNELDLTSGDTPLREFLTQKPPGDADTRRYLAIAHWLKAHRNIDSVGMDHATRATGTWGGTCLRTRSSRFRTRRRRAGSRPATPAASTPSTTWARASSTAWAHKRWS